MARHHYETLQQVFDDAYRGLAAQGFTRSTKDDSIFSGCQYRGHDGMRCAIGMCIPDDRYDPMFDDCPSLATVVNRSGVFGDIRLEALAQLQVAHDKGDTPLEMRERLANFASAHGLTIPSIEGAA